MSTPAIVFATNLPQSVTAPLAQRFCCLDASAGPLDPALARDIRGMAVLGGRIDGNVLDLYPSLEIIANFGVGYDNIDVDAALERGITVTHTPNVLNDEVADTAIGLLLMTVRRLSAAEQYLRQGRWRDAPFPLSATSLRGRSVGIVGMGKIGGAIAKRIGAFDVDVSYHSRKPKPDSAFSYVPTLLDLAAAVDTLIVVVPGGPETRHLIDAAVLEALGPNGVLINVARGSVVDESALIAALGNGTIAAVGLDVFENEPHIPEALLQAENAVLLPHVGTASVPTRNAMGQLVVENIVSWFVDGRAVTPIPECA